MQQISGMQKVWVCHTLLDIYDLLEKKGDIYQQQECHYVDERKKGEKVDQAQPIQQFGQ